MFSIQLTLFHGLLCSEVTVFEYNRLTSVSRQYRTDLKVTTTRCRGTEQASIQVERATVGMKNQGGLVKYQTCLIFIQPIKSKQETQASKVNKENHPLEKALATDKLAQVEHSIISPGNIFNCHIMQFKVPFFMVEN